MFPFIQLCILFLLHRLVREIYRVFLFGHFRIATNLFIREDLDVEINSKCKT